MLTSKEIIAEAGSRTGLEDLGDDSFREPMERMLDAVNHESRFSPLGANAFREMLIKAVANRLEVEESYRQHPEIDDEEIVAPVFGVGMPRTGSSFLSSLMALDPQTRSLRTWESPSPCPPPILGEIDVERLAVAQQRIDQYKERYPQLFAMVPMGVHEPTECYEILMNAFCCDYYYQFADCVGFLEWFWDPARDYSFGYRYHKRILKILQWRCPPKRWVLKMPGHSVMIEGLFKVYPDARFIMTHREPVKVMPSIAKLVAVIRESFLADARTEQFCEYQVNIWEKSMRRLLDFRDRHEGVFIDIYHDELLAHPQGEMARLYNWLGWSLQPSLVNAMEKWCAAHPRVGYQSKAGSYLDLAEVGRRFMFYSDRFYSEGRHHLREMK